MEWIFSSSALEQNSPSRIDGISADLEISYRRKSAWFLEELGKELKPQCDRMVVSTALVLFHRFYAFQSFKKHSRFVRILPFLLFLFFNIFVILVFVLLYYFFAPSIDSILG